MSLTDFLFNMEFPRTVVTVRSNLSLIFFCRAVILSYGLNAFPERRPLPAIPLLLGTGIVLRMICFHFKILVVELDEALKFTGTIGLILIVLEAAMDLRLTGEKRWLLKRSLLLSGAIIAGGSGLIALLFWGALGAPPVRAILNAIPFAVMSSAVVSPSTTHLPPDDREFMVYVATLSDVIGVLLFNFVLSAGEGGGDVLQLLVGNVVLTIASAVVLSALLIALFQRIAHEAKFFLIFALITLLYTLGKIIHLSPLLMVFLFGLSLNNPHLFETLGAPRFLDEEDLSRSARDFKLVLLELTFFAKTFFFILFGMSIDPSGFLSPRVLGLGAAIMAIIYLAQYGAFRCLAGGRMHPDWLVAPRGLITALLFLSVPHAERIHEVGGDLLSFVILTTSMVMSVALVRSSEPAAGGAGSQASEEARRASAS